MPIHFQGFLMSNLAEQLLDSLLLYRDDFALRD
jgi:hypothetical protein